MLSAKSIVVVALLVSFSLGIDAQPKSETAALEAMAAAKKEQAAQILAAAAAAEKLDKAADLIIGELQHAVGANASAKTYDAILQKISSLSANNREYGRPNSKLEASRIFATHWQDYLFAASEGKSDLMIQILRQLAQEAAGVPVIARSELMYLQQKLSAQLAEAEAAVLPPLLKHFEASLASANTTEDLQPFLKEVIAAQNALSNKGSSNQNSPSLPVIYQIRQFTSRWQDGLSLFESGNISGAQATLFNLFDDKSSYNDIAVYFRPHRARVLSKVNEAKSQLLATNPTVVATIPPAVIPPPAPEGPKPETLTVDNLEQLLGFLKKNPKPEQQKIQSAVEHLLRGRLALRENLRATRTVVAESVDFSLLTGVYAIPLNSIRQKMLLQSIKADLNSSLVALPDETPIVFLRRIIQSELTAGHWHAAHEALVLQQEYAGSSTPDEIGVIPGLVALITGIKHEEVGQYAAAETLYMRALSNPSKLLPVKELETRLKDIKGKAAKETAAATLDPLPPSTFGDSRANCFLVVGLLTGVLATLGIKRLQRE